jgi:hypothetical protein
MEKGNVNRKSKQKGKEDKNILIVNNMNPKVNYKREEKEPRRETFNKMRTTSNDKEKSTQRFKFKGSSIRDVRKMAMKVISNEVIKRYNTSNDEYHDVVLDSLICNKNCHIVAIFKDYMIFDFVDEFLKR